MEKWAQLAGRLNYALRRADVCYKYAWKEQKQVRVNMQYMNVISCCWRHLLPFHYSLSLSWYFCPHASSYFWNNVYILSVHTQYTSFLLSSPPFPPLLIHTYATCIQIYVQHARTHNLYARARAYKHGTICKTLNAENAFSTGQVFKYHGWQH